MSAELRVSRLGDVPEGAWRLVAAWHCLGTARVRSWWSVREVGRETCGLTERKLPAVAFMWRVQSPAIDTDDAALLRLSMVDSVPCNG
jgi:hypothetical protein